MTLKVRWALQGNPGAVGLNPKVQDQLSSSRNHCSTQHEVTIQQLKLEAGIMVLAGSEQVPHVVMEEKSRPQGL